MSDSDPDVQSDRFYITLLFENPVQMQQFLLKLLLISCCVPRFLLRITAKFHSHVKDSESEILESRSWSQKSDILPPIPQPCSLYLFFEQKYHKHNLVNFAKVFCCCFFITKNFQKFGNV